METSSGGGDRSAQPIESENLSARSNAAEVGKSCHEGSKNAKPQWKLIIEEKPKMGSLSEILKNLEVPKDAESAAAYAKRNSTSEGDCSTSKTNTKSTKKVPVKSADQSVEPSSGLNGVEQTTSNTNIRKTKRARVKSLTSIEHKKKRKIPNQSVEPRCDESPVTQEVISLGPSSGLNGEEHATTNTQIKKTKKARVNNVSSIEPKKNGKNPDQSIEPRSDESHLAEDMINLGPSSGLNGLERATTNTIVKKRRSVRVNSERGIEPKEKSKNGQSVEPIHDESPETEDVINLGGLNAVDPADYMESGTFVCMISKSPFDLPVTQANSYMRYGRKIMKKVP